jgi:hypothetical protein
MRTLHILKHKSKYKSILLAAALILSLYSASGASGFRTTPDSRDSVDRQLLFNGRIWRNLYSRVRGDQFLFSSDFIPGSVTINGKTFTGCSLRYDICNDQLLTRAGQNIIIQLNKEMVSSFTMDYLFQQWNFMKIEGDTVSGPGGYGLVLYKGNSSLFVKYRKIIMLLAIDNKYDVFEQGQKLWLQKDGRFYQISRVKDITDIYADKKQQITNFIRTQRLKVSRKKPESFIPLVEFCDKSGK